MRPRGRNSLNPLAGELLQPYKTTLWPLVPRNLDIRHRLPDPKVKECGAESAGASRLQGVAIPKAARTASHTE